MRLTLTGLSLFACFLSFSSFYSALPMTLERSFANGTDSSVDRSFQPINNISNSTIHSMGKSYGKLDRLVTGSTERMLQRMQKKELALQKKLDGSDSGKAKEVFASMHDRYQQLIDQLHKPISQTVTHSLKEYIPGIDSIQTAIGFLQHSGAAMSDLPAGKLQQLQQVSAELQQLQNKLQTANEIRDFVRQREQQLKDQLAQYGLGKQLLGINKEAYYYQQQLAQYKTVLKDQTQQERLVLTIVRKLPAFQRFWQKNSMIAQMFPTPANYGTPQALAGVETRDQVSAVIQQRFGTSVNPAITPAPGSAGSGMNAQQMLQQQVSQAQTKLSDLKDRLTKLGISGGGNSNMTMPDFTPNPQHNSTFFKRLQFGFNIQNSGSTPLLPAISLLGLSAGYKLSDKMTAGLGIAYQLGLGNGINHLQFSNQGVSLRSYVDMKIKGSIWVTGGGEYSYMQAFAKFSDLRKVDVWQKSALIGLSKKYKLGKKEANIQVLYDLLAGEEVPRGQAFKIRTGWGL